MQKGMVAAVIAAVALLACAGLAAADIHVGLYAMNPGTLNTVEYEFKTINDYVTGPWGPNVRLPYQLSITRVGVEVTVSWVSDVGAGCNLGSGVVWASVVTQLPERFRPALTQRPVYFANANGRNRVARFDVTPDGWLYFYADIDGSAWTTPAVNNDCRIYTWTANWRVA